MDIILLGITVISLIVALVMSVTAWRLMRDEKQRSAARVAALSVAANEQFPDEQVVKPVTRAPWASPSIARSAAAAPVASVRMPNEFSSELPLNQTHGFGPPEGGPSQVVAGWSQGGGFSEATARAAETPVVTHATGFLGATEIPRDNGGRQKSLAVAAVILFAVLSGGLAWMMSGPEGTSAVAVGPNSPLELMSLTSVRQNDKLAVSGLVRNPVNGAPVEKLSAVVFLFDRMGTFVTSSRAHVDFLKIGAGDESPFVVTLDAPATVARYRVSFRTDEGIVPHVDRRTASPAPAEGEQAVTVSSK